MIRELKWSEPRENAYTRLKMQRWVRSIDRIADALPKPRIAPASAEEEREALSEALCANCDRLPICWHEQSEQTREGMQALAERGEDTEAYLEIINQYFSACPRIAQIPPLLSRLDEDRQRRGEKAICADYERDMLCTHLTALSQAAQRISLEGLSGDSEESEWIRQVEEVLQAVRFPGETAFVKRVDGHMTVCLKCDPLSVHPTDGELLRKIRKLRRENAILSIALVGVGVTGYKLLKLMKKVVLENAELNRTLESYKDKTNGQDEDGE